MTQATSPPPASATAADYGRERTGWTGWITFAAIMMIISGGLNALYGLIGIVNDQWVVWTNRGSLLLDITQWGWVHLIIGAVMVLAGIGLFSGRMAGPHRGRDRREPQPHREFRLHPRLPAVGADRDHHRCARDLGAHCSRQGDAPGLSPSALVTWR